MRDRRLRTFATLVLSVVLLVTLASVATADLQTTNILRAWDDTTQRYENGNMVMFLNSQPETFYTKVDFDNDPHTGACGVSNPKTTPWSGDAIIGLYHTDNAPAGAIGFVSSGNWKLVRCSTFGANDRTKFPAPADVLATCVPGNPEDGPCILIGTPDSVLGCTSGNCTNEIQTSFHINADYNTDPNLACDGTMDAPFAAEWNANPTTNNLCLYWEAQKPPNQTPFWKGNFQVRYGTGAGGEKTINFSDKFLGPNAVGLRSFAGASTLNLLPPGLVVAAVGLGALALVWRSVQLRRNAR